MKKKLLLIILVLVLSFLCSCEIVASEYTTLPDLSGLSRTDIKHKLAQSSVSYIFGFDKSKYYGPDGYNKFVSYQNHDVGDRVRKDETIRVLTSPLELPDIDVTKFTFTRDAKGKSFFSDSYGYVTWSECYADGDTTTFRDVVTNKTFKVRFLVINTPEVSHGYGEADPWADEAALYLKNILRKAKTIIVESEALDSVATDVYSRYLGYVWADGVCLNYLMVCECYSSYNGSSHSCRYDSIFREAYSKAISCGRRFYGEVDPNN